MPDAPSHSSRKQKLLAALLIGCVMIVGFWEIMSNRNRGPSTGFELTNDDLRGAENHVAKAVALASDEGDFFLLDPLGGLH